MRWRGERQSTNIEVRRSGRRGGAAVGGLGAVVVVVLGLLFGVDVTPLLRDGGQSTPAPIELTAEEREATAFVATVLAYTDDTWKQVFRDQTDGSYAPVKVIDFRGVDDQQGACGFANAASGPFYCPGDRQIYIDTEFFATLHRELGAGGDFAAAYVVAHEVAHHVQNLLGTLAHYNAIRQRSSDADSNAISVRIELQADCYSGIWAKAMERRLGALDAGDIAEAVNAARQIGDDVLMRRSGQRPQAHLFTHGSADQRARWFLTGYKTGSLLACDTFSAERL